MQYQNKYNIANEDFLVRGNESLLCPKLGTTFQRPSWSCAEVLFPPHHGRPIRQLFCNKSNRIDSECLCQLQLEMLISLLTLFFTKEALFHCFHAFQYCSTWSLAAWAVLAACFQLAACFTACLSLIGCSRKREIQNDDCFENGGKFKRSMLNRCRMVVEWHLLMQKSDVEVIS